MKIFFLSTIILLTLSVFSAAQNKSIYTSTSEKVCKQQKVADDYGGDYVGICPGVGGYKLELIEGDLRQTLIVITPAKRRHQLNFTNFYMTFSAIDRKIEWRVKRGVPIALIARYNVADAENSEKRKSYLMVAKISRTQSCVTDVVLPSKNQNSRARKLADLASSKPCKRTGE
jgi:hypothetical protein